MSSSSATEHYVTLFDKNYLPVALAMYESLRLHAQPFHLWIICMDDEVEDQLNRLGLPDSTLLSLAELETPDLRRVKPGRSRGEYCWTVTPFSPQAVFDAAPEVERVTYIDADLFFFSNPSTLFQEFEETGKHVLITEHAYDPQYDQSATSGRFCVQFMVFRNTTSAKRVMSWWQERCIEWCFARLENGKFGDQKYLDEWPELFQEEVHVLKNTRMTLAPWNVDYLGSNNRGGVEPVFYHFHSLRIISPDRVRLWSAYKLGPAAHRFYGTYRAALVRARGIMQRADITFPCIREPRDIRSTMRRIKHRVLGTTRTAEI